MCFYYILYGEEVLSASLLLQYLLPELDTAESQRTRAFIGWLKDQRPFFPTLHVIRWVKIYRTFFFEKPNIKIT